MSVPRTVFVLGRRYPVYERSGYIKAHLFDKNGWTSVWATDFTQLVQRIRASLDDRQ